MLRRTTGMSSNEQMYPTRTLIRYQTAMGLTLDDIPERPRSDGSATRSEGAAVERSLRNGGVSETDARDEVAVVVGAIALPSINRGAALNIVRGRRPNK